MITYRYTNGIAEWGYLLHGEEVWGFASRTAADIDMNRRKYGV